MFHRHLWLLPFLGLVLSSPSHAKTWTVPSEIPSIQEAIDVASDSDTVAVEPGTYSENLTIAQKNLVLLGISGAEQTVIDGTPTALPPPLLAISGVDTTTLIRGFTFQNNGLDSTRYTYGGAISMPGHYPTSPRIEANIFRNNWAEAGGAISHAGTSRGPVIRNNVFENNRAFSGGAIELWASSNARIDQNVFMENAAYQPEESIGLGGAIVVTASADSTRITSNVFYKNTSGYGAAIGTWAADESILIERNTFALNGATFPNDSSAVINLIDSSTVATCTNNIFALALDGWAVAGSNGAGAIFSCNVFWRNHEGDYMNGPVGPGNPTANPLFCDPFSGDLTLALGSPCLPGNSGGCGLIGALGQGCSVALGVEEPPVRSGLVLEVARVSNGRLFLSVRGLSESEEATLEIFDIQGRRVRGHQLTGTQYQWSGRDATGRLVASGVYFGRVVAGDREAKATFVYLR